jgi:hypothetical protein
MDEYLKQLTEWNENNPIGTEVRVTEVSGGRTFDTTTTSEAVFLGSDVVVVWVDHEFGCRLLRLVEAI